MSCPNNVPKLYTSVVDDVINNVRESFLDEGVEEQVLQELKQLWETKIQQSKAVDQGPVQQDKMLAMLTQQAPQRLVQHPAPTHPAAAAAPQPQMPIMFNSATGTIEMSRAAQAATLALPASVFQQNLGPLQGNTFTLTGPGGSQFILQTSATGQPQIVQPQNVTNTGTPAAYTITTQVAGDPQGQRVVQVDGPNDTSSEDDDDDDDGDGKDDDGDEEQNEEYQGEEEDPLNSGDDISDEEPAELFDTDNVVVCQFDKISRSKNKWKFGLKDGIMNISGRDYVFQKATGDAEW